MKFGAGGVAGVGFRNGLFIALNERSIGFGP
jgi:hypothetical protein